MRFNVFLAAAIGIGSALIPVEARADDLSLESAGDWDLTKLEDRCRLSRIFGQGDDRTSLWIEQGGRVPAYNLTLIGDPFRQPYGEFLAVQFSPESEYSRAYISAESSRGRPVISLFGARLTPTRAEIADSREASGYSSDEEAEIVDLTAAQTGSRRYESPEISAQRLEAITHLRLSGPLQKPVTLQTGSLVEPLADLQGCAEELTEQIGRNTRSGGTGATTLDERVWAVKIQQNYPTPMLRRLEEASVGVRLTIGTNGRPSYCEITGIDGRSSFNDSVCITMLRHATFNPARDAEGNPVVSFYSTRVTFRLNN